MEREMKVTADEVRDRILDNIRPASPDIVELEGVDDAVEEILKLIKERSDFNVECS